MGLTDRSSAAPPGGQVTTGDVMNRSKGHRNANENEVRFHSTEVGNNCRL